MRTLTWNEAKETIKRIIGTCDNATALGYANEAQERLLNRSTDPDGTVMRYRFCAGSSNCLVLPRQVRHVKAFWVCNEPGLVMSQWYEAIGYWNGGRGLLDDDSHPGTMLVDQGTACSFDNVTASTSSPRKLQIVASDPSDNGKYVTLRYLDASGNRKYTSIDGVVQEGERLALSTTGTLTSSNVLTNGLYHVVKAVTNYPVRIYSYDTTHGLQDKLLACYEPSETIPIYRRMYAPGLIDMAGCNSASSGCGSNKTVTIAARLQHVPVAVDNDPFVIGNLAALKLMVKGIRMEEQHETTLAEYYFNSASREIDGEIAATLGEGERIAIRTPDRETWGPGQIFNAVG